MLYISSLGALNVRFLNGTIVRVDGYDGLPYPNVTSLAVQHRPATTWTTARTILHIGTQAGLSSADITPATTAMSTGRRTIAGLPPRGPGTAPVAVVVLLCCFVVLLCCFVVLLLCCFVTSLALRTRCTTVLLVVR